MEWDIGCCITRVGHWVLYYWSRTLDAASLEWALIGNMVWCTIYGVYDISSQISAHVISCQHQFLCLSVLAVLYTMGFLRSRPNKCSLLEVKSELNRDQFELLTQIDLYQPQISPQASCKLHIVSTDEAVFFHAYSLLPRLTSTPWMSVGWATAGGWGFIATSCVLYFRDCVLVPNSYWTRYISRHHAYKLH